MTPLIPSWWKEHEAIRQQRARLKELLSNDMMHLEAEASVALSLDGAAGRTVCTPKKEK